MKQNPSFVTLKMFMFFGSAINTMIISFLPIYFQDRGITSSQIGWFLAIGPLMGLFAQPLWGFASDKFHTVKKVLTICLTGVFASAIWLFQIDEFLWLLASGALFFFFFTPVLPFGDNLAKRSAQMYKVDFGSIRMWGSIGFATASLISGWILTKLGVDSLFTIVITLTFITGAMTLFVRDINAGNGKVDYKKAGKLFKDPFLLMFVVFISLVTLTHRTSDSFISLYLMEIGGNEMQVGWIWFVGVSSEALLFFLSAYWFKGDHAIKYMMLAAILYAVRWILTGFASDPATLLLIQVLHGVCFAIVFISALEYLYRLVPSELQATGHMIFVGISFGVTGIIGSSAGGVIFENFGGSTLYFCLAGVALAGLAGLVVFYFQDKARRSEKAGLSG